MGSQTDGDVSTDDTLWYRPASAKVLKSAGVMELSLPDNPTTAPAEDPISGKSFIGPPTSLNVSEGFVIILAKRSGDEYTKLDAWSWSYSDKSEKVKKVWKTTNFKHSFEQVSVDVVNLSGMTGEDRANNKSKTAVTEK